MTKLKKCCEPFTSATPVQIRLGTPNNNIKGLDEFLCPFVLAFKIVSNRISNLKDPFKPLITFVLTLLASDNFFAC
jgi:hypothetical protein